jgi:hypothetical protein
MSLHQNNNLLLVHDKRCIVSHWPPASEIGMLLITNFLERWQFANMPSHAITLPRPCHGFEKSLTKRYILGMLGKRQGNGMVCVNQTRLHCVNQMRKTQSKALAERHGGGTAWYV